MTHRASSECSRRHFVTLSASCAAHVALLAAGGSAAARRVFARERGRLVSQVEPWGRLERIADGAWALVSTPLDDRLTLCNGGIVAGRDRVVVIESFARPDGAAWVAEQARRLTGRWPTDVVLTHYHGDHTAGVEGFARDGRTTQVHVTATTRTDVREGDAGRAAPPSSARRRLLDEADVLPETSVSELNLGDRQLRIIPREGHTRSDVTIELTDPSVVWAGDLVWNGMFPNYMDATPSRLSRDVRALMRDRDTVYVPGHGPLADGDALRRYLDVIDDVETAARRAADAGTPAADAARMYQVPDRLGEWMLFSPRYFEVAFRAWERELGRGQAG